MTSGGSALLDVVEFMYNNRPSAAAGTGSAGADLSLTATNRVVVFTKHELIEMSKSKRPVVLIVRDGWGHNPHPEFNDCNAILLGKTPVNDRLLQEYPNTQIHTSGEDVGLPDGVMGNSEVGHQNIGAGRIVNQQLMRITTAIRDGSFYDNATLDNSISHVQKTGGKVHLIGLLSDGGVHSHVDHAVALVDYYKRRELAADVVVHAILDGRDTSPTGGIEFMKSFEKALLEMGVGRVGSVIGRFFAMDRDFRWDRVQKAYDLFVHGGPTASSATDAIAAHYANPDSSNQSGDEFMPAVSIAASGEAKDNQIQAGDAVVFFNFRGDRPRELTKAFILEDDDWKAIKGGGFDRGARLDNLFFATMVEYEEGLGTDLVFSKQPRMVNILGEVIKNRGLSQFRCAESEKHPHVTYFFNDYLNGCYLEELQIEIPSPKHVATYDQLPSMSAAGVTGAVLNAIESDLFDFILVNFANPDMVGHTGVLSAAITAVETVDASVGRVVDAVLERGGAVVVTADHGNCEQMYDPESGGPHTKHTTYDVDLIVVDNDLRGRSLRDGGRLADIAPTVLELLKVDPPVEMTGKSLIDPA